MRIAEGRTLDTLLPAVVGEPYDLRLMRWLDEQFSRARFMGAGALVGVMRCDGLVVNRKRVKRLMRVMGREA